MAYGAQWQPLEVNISIIAHTHTVQQYIAPLSTGHCNVGKNVDSR